jgi:hypothetical protein
MNRPNESDNKFSTSYFKNKRKIKNTFDYIKKKYSNLSLNNFNKIGLS